MRFRPLSFGQESAREVSEYKDLSQKIDEQLQQVELQIQNEETKHREGLGQETGEESQESDPAAKIEISKAEVMYTDPYNQYLYSGNYMLE